MNLSDFINIESLTFDEGRIYVVSGQNIDEILSLLDSAKTAIDLAGKTAIVYDSRHARPYFFDHLLPKRRDVDQRYARAYNAFSYNSVAPLSLLTKRGPNDGAPVIDSVSPNTGPLVGGTSVTISGQNMGEVVLVTFDGVPATIVSVSSTNVVVLSPAKSSAGGVDVDVVTADNQAGPGRGGVVDSTDGSGPAMYEHASLVMGDTVMLVANQFDPNDKRQNFLSSGIVVDTMLDLFDAMSVLSVRSSHSSRYGLVRELWPFVSRVYFYDVDDAQVSLIKPDQTPERPPFPFLPFVTVSQPDASTTLSQGDILDVRWTTFEVPIGVDIKVELYKGGSLQGVITPSGTGLGYNTPNSGTFKWQVGDALAGSDYQLKISTTSGPLVSVLSDFFAIV